LHTNYTQHLHRLLNSSTHRATTDGGMPPVPLCPTPASGRPMPVIRRKSP
jgi:hypothetical protein